MTAVIENQRLLHEEVERLEQGVADRLAEEPRNIRDRLIRDHEIGHFLTRFEDQSRRLYETYQDEDGSREKEVYALTHGDPFDEFYKHLAEIKDFHRRYPNEPVEDLSRTYKRRPPQEGEMTVIDNMFTGEEFHGRFFDLTQQHEDYLNLKGAKRLTYLQYLSQFDKFADIPRVNKNDGYFAYLTSLAKYLENFLARTRPLDNPQVTLDKFSKEFDKAWEDHNVPGWKVAGPVAQPQQSENTIYCQPCAKEFTNKNTYDAHLTGKKHVKAAAALEGGDSTATAATTTAAKGNKDVDIAKLKDRAIAERETRIAKLTEILSKERDDTLTNVERKASLTERERQAELDQLFQESFTTLGTTNIVDDEDDDDEEKIYNPLKLPLAWDGKPIPYWLYKLHGLGVEHTCEICGNFVYMGRRAFDKHFTEGRHTHGLRCLGISNTTLFREITGIEEALKLNEKLKSDKKKQDNSADNIIQMEDGEGNVMPAKVYYDLQKQGLL